MALSTALLAGAISALPMVAGVQAVYFEARDVGFLGVHVAEVDQRTASRLKLPRERGVLVLAVQDNSPAKVGGLQVDDVLWTFRDEPLHSVAQLRRLLRETPPGRSVSIEFYRNGSVQGTGITVARHAYDGEFRLDLPDFHLSLPRDFLRFGPFAMVSRPRLGVSVVPLTQQLADHLGAQGGLLVTVVEHASAAEKAGIRAGDVIQRIDGRSLASVADLRNALEDKKEVALELVRDHKTRTVTVSLAESRLRGPVL